MSAAGRFYRLSDEDIAMLAEMSDLVDEMYAKYFREHANPSMKCGHAEWMALDFTSGDDA